MNANTPRANPRMNPRPVSHGSDFNPGTLLVGFYQPLNTPVHRAPLWLKGGLFFGLFIVLAVTDWQVALVAALGLALRHATLLVTFLDVLGLALLLAGIAGLVAAGHGGLLCLRN